MLASADVALTASGTATVQTALHDTPMVIVYRVSPLSYRLLRRLVKVDAIGMVNLIAGERIVPELVQDAFTPEAVAREAISMLTDRERAARIRAGLATVRARLGGPGASRRAAEAILRVVRDDSRRLKPARVTSVDDRPLRETSAGCVTLACMRTLMVCGVLLALALPARATVIVPADLGELSRDARAIVRGRVAALDAQWTEDRGTIETIVTLEVESYLKGALGPTLQFPRPRRRARTVPQHRRRRAGVHASTSASSCSSARGAERAVRARSQPGCLPRRSARPTMPAGS